VSLPMILSRIVLALRAAGCVFAEEEAELLVEAAASPTDLADMVARRAAGFPLEQILGWAEFRGLRIVVEPGVFVPRRRSEVLAGLASDLTAERATVVDLCCGTGALGAALLAAHPGIDLYAADIDPAAVRCARRNLDVRVYEGDLYKALPERLLGTVDVLVVNAPYVPTDAIETMPPEARLHEARVALDGGHDGLDVHRRVAADATRWLAPGGHLLIETSERQAPAAVEILRRAGLATRFEHDDDLGATVVIGRRPGDHSIAP
jgi:release factor glutamine methyltransferase